MLATKWLQGNEASIHWDLWKKSLAICFMWFPLFQQENICISKTSCFQVLQKRSPSVLMWKARELQHCSVGLTADANEEQSRQRRETATSHFCHQSVRKLSPTFAVAPKKFLIYSFSVWNDPLSKAQAGVLQGNVNSYCSFLPGTNLYPKLGVEAMELTNESNINRKIHLKIFKDWIKLTN